MLIILFFSAKKKKNEKNFLLTLEKRPKYITMKKI